MVKVSMETIGDRIRRLRLAKGMTQQQLADIDALRVQRNLVNYWENDERDIKSGQIVALADFFNVTCDYLLRGVDAAHVDTYKEMGIRENSIRWFRERKKAAPFYVEAFNQLFEDEKGEGILADILFGAIVEFVLSKYVIFIEKNHALGLMAGHPLERELNYEQSRMLLLSQGQMNFAFVLETIGKRWDAGTDEAVKIHQEVADQTIRTLSKHDINPNDDSYTPPSIPKKRKGENEDAKETPKQ